MPHFSFGYVLGASLAAAIGVGCSSSSDAEAPSSWYLELDGTTTMEEYAGATQWRRHAGERTTLTLEGTARGHLTHPDGTIDTIDSITQKDDWIEFRQVAATSMNWFRVRIADGTMSGRWMTSADGTEPALSTFTHFVSGWNSDAFPLRIPLSWDLTIAGVQHARVRIDAGEGGALVGRYKLYADDRLDNPGEIEELEYDLLDVHFDGTMLSFTRRDPAGSFEERVMAHADGRFLEGVIARDGGETWQFEGTRSNLFAYGLTARANRDEWQAATRRRIANLSMAGNPAPTAPCDVTLGASQPPFSANVDLLETEYYPGRDDDAASWPPNYTVQELTMRCRVTSAFDGSELPARTIHGYVATPQKAAEGRHLGVIAINGHGGTAYDVLSPDTLFWYGDSFARRGQVVVAIDIKHHPDEEIAGEDGTHPPIGPDWEEDGERVWDVERAMDWLSSLPNVDPHRIRLTGLSMGGEVTTAAAAMDTRFSGAIPSGWSPDTDVLDAIGSHGCWMWRHANIREYVDQSDLHALVAPRSLIVQTGKLDINYSFRPLSYSGDVQVMRRTRAAYAPNEQTRVQHYLHDGPHVYRVGDRVDLFNAPIGVQVTTPPGDPLVSLDWQTVGTTTKFAPSLFLALRRTSQDANTP